MSVQRAEEFELKPPAQRITHSFSPGIEDVFGDDVEDSVDYGVRKVSKMKLPHEQEEETRLIQTDLTPAEVKDILAGCLGNCFNNLTIWNDNFMIPRIFISPQDVFLKL